MSGPASPYKPSVAWESASELGPGTDWPPSLQLRQASLKDRLEQLIFAADNGAEPDWVLNQLKQINARVRDNKYVPRVGECVKG